MYHAYMSDIKIGIIGGSGLGEAIGSEEGTTIEVDTPFGKTSSPILQTTWHHIDIAILQRHGPGHLLSPSKVPYRANIFALKSLGVTHILASGATGSLQEEIRPGDLVIVDQLIDKTTKRANTFYENAATHTELADPFCPVMRDWLITATSRIAQQLPDCRVHQKGTYIVMEGPAFSTKAESHMHRQWGGDLIGMTAMPEAKLAREAEIAYALIGLPTDYDCWRPHKKDVEAQDLLAEIIGNLNKASHAGITLMKAALSNVTPLLERRSPAHDALKLAIWSNKEMIDQNEIQKLSVLWQKYFQ